MEQIEKQPVQVAVRAILRRLQFLFSEDIPSADGTSASQYPGSGELWRRDFLCCVVMCYALLCYKNPMSHFRLKCCTFGNGRHASHWQTALPGGSRRGIVIVLRIIHQTITCLWRKISALGTEQILPLYSAEVKMAYLPKRAALKMPYPQPGQECASRRQPSFIEAGGKVLQRKLVGTHVIAFVGINAGEGAQQNGKGAVTPRFMMRRTRRSCMKSVFKGK